MEFPKFLTHLRFISWDSPNKVQVLVREGEDNRFHLINVMGRG